MLPDRPWQKLHCDFKGPIAGKYYLHVIIDQYSKFPEVDIWTSTSFEKLRPILDRVFSTHGIPETVSSDNGPPFPSHDLEQYAKHMGFRLTPVPPDDPQSNGLVENFIKSLCKIIHAAVAEGKNTRSELYNYLLQYRATPHTTTGKSPAEMIFNRKIQTKLPQLYITCEDEDRTATRRFHDQNRMKQKQYFEKRYKARPKTINIGDQVLLKQQKSMTRPPYDPNPYTVYKLHGNSVHVKRGQYI